MTHFLKWLTLSKLFIPDKISTGGTIPIPDYRLINTTITENMPTGRRAWTHQHFQTNRTSKLAA